MAPGTVEYEDQSRVSPPRRERIYLDSPQKFVREGIVQIGPKAEFFVFVDGDYLGALLSEHFGVGAETGYTSLGRLRVTVERLEEPDASAPGA
jgi:hypothetical protein